MCVRIVRGYARGAAVVLALLTQELQAQQGWLKPFSEARYEPYRTPGMFLNDFRFVKVEDTYYAFFLQLS